MTIPTSPLTAFLATRSLSGPDGRHIYAYRISASESATFAAYLREHLDPGETRYPPLTAKVFCLWAADYWRRTYEGGIPSWTTILDEIDAGHLAAGASGYPALTRLVQDGIQGLGLELLVIGHTREFLATLICEGGLPLKVVTRGDQHALPSFFRAIFRACEAHRVGDRLAGNTTTAELARQAGSYLPRTLRQPVVFELAAQIVAETLRLLPLVGDAPDPIVVLDRYDTRWREAFPLDLPDDVSRAFLGQLVQSARAAQRQGGSPLRFVRSLVKQRGETGVTGPGDADRVFHLEGALELPRRIGVSDLAGLVQSDDLPARFDLALRSGVDSTTVAIASVREDDEGRYVRFDSLRAGRSIVSGDAAAGEQRLLLRSARDMLQSVHPFRGSAALSELPWVFVAREDGGPLEFHADRATSVRAASTIVAVPIGSILHPLDDRSCVDRLGALAITPAREVYELRGHVRIEDAIGNRSDVRTDSEQDDEREHVVTGRRYATLRGDGLAFLGQPTVREARASGLTLAVPIAELEWRSALPNATWRRMREGVIGDGILRRVQQGATTYSARIQVLPPAFEVQVRPSGSHSGTLVLQNLDGADADVVRNPAWTSTVRRTSGNTVEIDVTFVGAAPASIPVRLVWTGSGAATIDVPAPIEHVRFEDMRSGLQVHSAGVAASQLTYFRASAMMPDRRREFWIEGTLARAQAVGRNATEGVRRIKRDIPSASGGVYRLDMGEMQSAVEELLAGSDVLDDNVRLVIRAEPPLIGPSVELNASRYDLALDQENRDPLRLRGEDFLRLMPRDVENLRLIAFPITRPQDPPTVLAPAGAGVWCFDDEPSVKGPWLVSGWSGDWCRVRPMLVMRGNVEPPVTSASLTDAVLMDSDKRGPEIERHLDLMASNPGHPDWELVEGYLQWIPDFPASTFDVLRLLSRSPRAVTMAALRAAEREAMMRDGSVERLRKCLRTLPFSWHAVPRAAWVESIAHWVTARVSALTEANTADAPARAWDWFAKPVATLLCDEWMRWLRPVFEQVAYEKLGVLPPPSFVELGRPNARKKYRDALFDAMKELVVHPIPDPSVPSATAVHAALPAVKGLVDQCGLLFAQANQHQHEKNYHLVNAPLIAAVCAVRGAVLDSNAQAQLRAVHGYDTAWFDRAYDAAYRFGLVATLTNHWPSTTLA